MEKLISANALYAKGRYEEAFRAYDRLAAEGDLDAMFNVGYMYQFGVGTPPDYEKAADFYAVALYLEGGDAAYNLAVMHLMGLGVETNAAKAVKYMETAALAGCPEAQLYLAVACSAGYAGNPVYSNICRIPFHRAESKYDFIPVTGAIDLEREEKLEEERRRAIIQSEIDAHRWLTMAAYTEDEHDVYGDTITNAKYLLGLFHIEGVGCRINRKKGEALLREAAFAGSAEAKQYLLDAGKK